TPVVGGTYRGKEKGFGAVVFRVAMETLAEEERGAGAVRDVPQSNASVKGEDAVPGQAGKGRRSARMKRPLAGVAAITGHRIETPRPERGGLCRDFHHGFRQRIGRAEQDLDDLGLGGIPPPGDVVSVIVVVPLPVQVILLEVREQFDPQVGAPGRAVAHHDGKTYPDGELARGVVAV